MNSKSQTVSRNNGRVIFLDLLNDYHARSGMSLRQVAQACDLDYTYLQRILSGTRRPRRDVIIAMGFAYQMELGEVDEILLMAGYPPIGRGTLRAYQHSTT